MVQFDGVVDQQTIDELIEYQQFRICHYNLKGGEKIRLTSNLHDFFEQRRKGNDEIQFLSGPSRQYVLIVPKPYHGDKRKYSREVVWFGRKGGKFLNEVQEIKDIE